MSEDGVCLEQDYEGWCYWNVWFLALFQGILAEQIRQLCYISLHIYYRMVKHSSFFFVLFYSGTMKLLSNGIVYTIFIMIYISYIVGSWPSKLDSSLLWLRSAQQMACRSGITCCWYIPKTHTVQTCWIPHVSNNGPLINACHFNGD